MNHKIRSQIYSLEYQQAAGSHHYGVCSSESCTRTARGSAHCAQCVSIALGKEIGPIPAGQLRDLYRRREELQSDINELLEELK